MNRKTRRNRITKSQATKQHKVVRRAEQMIAHYKTMSISDLESIAEQKRSKTDTFAYHVALTELKNKAESPEEGLSI